MYSCKCKTMNRFRQILEQQFGVTSNIDDRTLRDLYDYFLPNENSLKIYPEVIIARNSVLANYNGLTISGPMNPRAVDLSGTPDTIASSLFFETPVTIATYAKNYYETGNLRIPANFVSELLDFMTSRQDVDGQVVSYIRKYVRDAASTLESVKEGLIGNPPIMDNGYLLGAILQESVDNAYEVLKELDMDVSPFWFVVFGSTEFIRGLLLKYEGLDDLPILLDAIASLPNRVFVECRDDIIRVADKSSYTAGRAYILGDVFKLWCLRSSVKELNPGINSDYEYLRGRFRLTPRIAQYYSETKH